MYPSSSLLLVPIVFLSGCSSWYWTHQDQNRLKNFNAEVANCQMYARKMTANNQLNPINASGAAIAAFSIAAVQQEYVETCLKSKGFYQVKE